jgi:hypothetical protein
VPDYTTLADFYHVNPAAVWYVAATHNSNPYYILVAWDQYQAVYQTCLARGFWLLGHSSFDKEDSNGSSPMREEAITFAKTLGADLVIYTQAPTQHMDSYGRPWITHDIAFLAKK